MKKTKVASRTVNTFPLFEDRADPRRPNLYGVSQYSVSGVWEVEKEDEENENKEQE